MPAPNPAPATALDAAALAEIRARKPSLGCVRGDHRPALAIMLTETLPTGTLRPFSREECGRHIEDHDALLAEVERLAAEVARLADAEMVAWLLTQRNRGDVWIESLVDETVFVTAILCADGDVDFSRVPMAVDSATGLPVLSDHMREDAAAAFRAWQEARHA